jgi:hypothetical protein
MQFLIFFFFLILLLQTYSCKNNTMLHSFLVGEGARTWAKSKGIALPVTVAEADKVNIFYFSPTILLPLTQIQMRIENIYHVEYVNFTFLRSLIFQL